ncbi:GNAT family N-acetyltransferase [Deinococcus sp.]|uniref:GNAT family N-acetyltransferase n=1 Tax=Deinococcus sp. TaxID=47478 RepID=UPI0025E433BE|nr:GNAT family N-acetyltransferase [Deinococcus sp.]
MTQDTDLHHLSIRQAGPGDLGTIHDLILSVGLSSERGNITATLEGCTYWIADLNGAAAGCIGLEHGEGASLLRSVSVLPSVRRRGLGRALAMSALTYASLRGDTQTFLFSTGAGPFWSRLGFEEVPVADLSAALPGTPQVRSGECRGWIHSEVAWRKAL